MIAAPIKNGPTVQLSDLIADVKPGFAVGERDPGGIIQVRMNNVDTDGALDLVDVIRVPASDKQIVDCSLIPGDVLFNNTNSTELVGKSTVFRGHNEPVTFSNHFTRLRVNSKRLNPYYLARWLTQQQRLGIFQGLCTRWVGQSAVRSEKVLALRIPLPSLPEQRRIADILDKADAIRRKRQSAVFHSDLLLKSTFRAAHGDPATNRHGWPKKKLGEVVNFVGGSQPPKDTFISEAREGYVRLVQIRDFKTDAYPTYIPRDMSRRFFDADDVMIARYGPPVFQILRGLSGSYNVALMKAEPTPQTTKDFLFHLLQIPEIHGVVVANSTRTAGQSGVNLDLLGNIVIPIPPVDRQVAISQTLQSIEAMSAKAVQFRQDANTLFSSLVQRAFRGEL